MNKQILKTERELQQEYVQGYSKDQSSKGYKMLHCTQIIKDCIKHPAYPEKE